MLSTMLVGIQLIQTKEGVQHMWVPITLATLFAYLVAHCFMTIYEVRLSLPPYPFSDNMIKILYFYAMII